MDVAIYIRVLQNRTVNFVIKFEFTKIADEEFNAQGLSPGFQNIDGLRQAFIRNKKGVCMARTKVLASRPVHQSHRLGSCRTFIK